MGFPFELIPLALGLFNQGSGGKVDDLLFGQSGEAIPPPGYDFYKDTWYGQILPSLLANMGTLSNQNYTPLPGMVPSLQQSVGLAHGMFPQTPSNYSYSYGNTGGQLNGQLGGFSPGANSDPMAMLMNMLGGGQNPSQAPSGNQGLQSSAADFKSAGPFMEFGRRPAASGGFGGYGSLPGGAPSAGPSFGGSGGGGEYKEDPIMMGGKNTGFGRRAVDFAASPLGFLASLLLGSPLMSLAAKGTQKAMGPEMPGDPYYPSQFSNLFAPGGLSEYDFREGREFERDSGRGPGQWSPWGPPTGPSGAGFWSAAPFSRGGGMGGERVSAMLAAMPF
jgi:hypothetical protein